MQTLILPAEDPQAIARALDTLRRGEPVVFPTDTVYGLGVLAHDAAGIEKLYAIKEREPRKAIAVLLSRVDQLGQVTAAMTPLALHLAERFWPGPLTLVVPIHPDLPQNLSPQPTVGVRMPDHPVARRLMDQSGPLATTSANLSGAESTRSAQAAYMQLAGRIPLILDGGETPGGTPSTVIDCTGVEPGLLREGPIAWETIQAALRNFRDGKR